MDARFVNPFVASIRNVFSTMLSTEVTIGKPTALGANSEPRADVSAIIGLSGDAVGCVILILPLQTAVNMGGKFACVEDMAPDHPDFSDALGELANMIAGHAKSKLDGLNVSISLPSVIIGQDHVVSQSRQRPRLLLPCESVLGNFSVEVAMLVEKQAARPPAQRAAAAT